jgi:hypothetical protein
LTLLAPTGERMGFYEAARQYDEEALRVIASVFMDDKQPASLRLAAANDLATGWPVTPMASALAQLRRAGQAPGRVIQSMRAGERTKETIAVSIQSLGGGNTNAAVKRGER